MPSWGGRDWLPILGVGIDFDEPLSTGKEEQANKAPELRLALLISHGQAA